MPIAFFDVDHTLVRGSTMLIATPWLVRAGLVRRRDLLKGVYYKIAFETGLLKDPTEIVRKAGAIFVGRTIDELRPMMHAALNDGIRPRMYVEALEAILRHRAQGHTIVLISGSSQYLLEAMRAELYADEIFGVTQRAGADGKLTPVFDEPLSIGDGKLAIAAKWLRETGRLGEETWFYTDSHTDLPLLQGVTHPRPVNPDAWLYAAALRNGWPVTRWRRTLGSAGAKAAATAPSPTAEAG